MTVLSRHSVVIYQENELSRKLSRNARPHPSQLAEPLCTDAGLKSWMNMRELTTIKKKKKNDEEEEDEEEEEEEEEAQAGNDFRWTFPQKLGKAGKSH